MIDKINGKAPEEIKLWVEYMSTTNVAKKIEIMNQGCPYQFNEDIAADALAYIQQLEAAQPKWISVEERLPEKHGQVCVGLYSQHGAGKSFLFPHVFTWHAYGDNGYVNGSHFSDEGLDGLKVYYWMPLPEPPMEDNDD